MKISLPDPWLSRLNRPISTRNTWWLMSGGWKPVKNLLEFLLTTYNHWLKSIIARWWCIVVWSWGRSYNNNFRRVNLTSLLIVKVKQVNYVAPTSNRRFFSLVNIYFHSRAISFWRFWAYGYGRFASFGSESLVSFSPCTYVLIVFLRIEHTILSKIWLEGIKDNIFTRQFRSILLLKRVQKVRLLHKLMIKLFRRERILVLQT